MPGLTVLHRHLSCVELRDAIHIATVYLNTNSERYGMKVQMLHPL